MNLERGELVGECGLFNVVCFRGNIDLATLDGRHPMLG